MRLKSGEFDAGKGSEPRCLPDKKWNERHLCELEQFAMVSSLSDKTVI